MGYQENGTQRLFRFEVLKKLNPRCKPSDEIDKISKEMFGKDYIFHYKPPQYNGQGFFIPCCWCSHEQDWLETNGFLDEDLKVENNEKLEDIFYSERWLSFYNDLEKENIEHLPESCKIKCSTKII